MKHTTQTSTGFGRTDHNFGKHNYPKNGNSAYTDDNLNGKSTNHIQGSDERLPPTGIHETAEPGTGSYQRTSQHNLSLDTFYMNISNDGSPSTIDPGLQSRYSSTCKVNPQTAETGLHGIETKTSTSADHPSNMGHLDTSPLTSKDDSSPSTPGMALGRDKIR